MTGGIKFYNVQPGETVHSRVTIVHGSCPPEYTSIVVYHHLRSFPATRWPVTQGNFKALVHLQPGLNDSILLDCGNGVSQRLVLNYVPMLQNMPLNFALIIGKDSPAEFDSPDYKKKAEGNGLETAVKKLRMASYLMQAFTQEQMNRNQFGQRTFPIAEVWAKDTLSNRDVENRTTTNVHVIRCDATVSEIRDPNRAQQNSKGNNTGDLFGIALNAIKKHGFPFNTDPTQVACIFLDAHWDPSQKLILGHAALGGGGNGIRLAIFGSHGLWSWPTCLEEVPTCFLDDKRTDTSVVANDSNQSGTAWEACNISMGAFMHEIGHLLGCPHQPSGVMLRDYITWNRSFMTKDGNFCARSNGPGQPLTLAKDECGWHRLDILRFRHHPSFRSGNEPVVYNPSQPVILPVDHGVFCRAPTGVYCVELHDGGGDAKSWIEYLNPPQTELFLFEDDLRQQLPKDCRNIKLRLQILACGEQQTEIDDISELINKSKPVDGQLYSKRYGGYGNDEDKVKMIQIPSDISKVRFYCGSSFDAIEFVSRKGGSIKLGGSGGGAHDFDLQPGEYITGINMRSGAWIDALGITTSSGRQSPIYGGGGGGLVHLEPPHGYALTGLRGTTQGWMVSLGIAYKMR